MAVNTIMPTRVGGPPWIGCGTTGQWDNVHDALEDADLLYPVVQTRAYDMVGNEIPGIKVNLNAYTHSQMGVTSSLYGVIQNADAFALLDPFCQIGGVIEHAGMTIDGMCFMVMRIPSRKLTSNGDEFDMFVCCMNSFNGKFPLAIIITPVRVVCQNMFRKLLANKHETVLSIKHGRMAENRLLSAANATEVVTSYCDKFDDTIMSLENESADPSSARKFAELMFPFVPNDAKHPRAAETNERIELLRDEFFMNYYLAPTNDYVGTKLGIINAYYDWVSHAKPVRASADWENRHLSGMLSGDTFNAKLLISARML